jgi:hypothetical protein
MSLRALVTRAARVTRRPRRPRKGTPRAEWRAGAPDPLSRASPRGAGGTDAPPTATHVSGEAAAGEGAAAVRGRRVAFPI